jgi:signal transduction histidine kinase
MDDARGHLNLERLGPGDLAHEVVREFGSSAEGRSVVLLLDPTTESAQIVGDISLIQRMIDNAMQHIPQGGTITAKLSIHDGHLVFEVSEPGRGIERAELDRIFNRYSRAGRERHTAGAGKRFTVHLPLAGPR